MSRYIILLISQWLLVLMPYASAQESLADPDTVSVSEVSVEESETSLSDAPEPNDAEVPAPSPLDAGGDVVDQPALAPAPVPPRVDPGLRDMYLGGRGVGGQSGPRALSKPEREIDRGLWKSEIEFGASGYRGNTDSELFMLRLKTERTKEHNSLRFGAKTYIGNKDGQRDRENTEAEVALRREIHNRWYYTAEVRYFTDPLADLDYQMVSVLSPGYEFIRTEYAHLSLELGPAFIAEKKGEEKKDFFAGRLALMMDRLIDDRILIWERFEYLPALEDTSVYLMLAEVGAESRLTDWFRLRTALQVRYDSDPAPDKENEDIFLHVSLVTIF